jgi:hypothetical protein
LAGFKVLDDIFAAPFEGRGTPYGEGGLPYGVSNPVRRAEGGSVGAPVPIVAAGGEYAAHPAKVLALAQHLGGPEATLDDGHRILDQFVTQYRAKTIKTLKGLPGPRKD